MRKLYFTGCAIIIGVVLAGLARGGLSPLQITGTSDIGAGIRRSALTVHEASTVDLLWYYSNGTAQADITGCDEVLFKYVTRTYSHVATITGSVNNATAGVIKVSFVPANLATNGSFLWQISLSSNGANVLKHPWGDLTIIRDATSTNTMPLGTNVDLASYTFQNAPWVGAGSNSSLGDILYGNGTAYVGLAPGTSNRVLRTMGTNAPPVWDDIDTNTLAGQISGLGTTQATHTAALSGLASTQATHAASITTLQGGTSSWNTASTDATTATNFMTTNAYVKNVTGDWTGTFDGQEGTYYLDRSNHTGTDATNDAIATAADAQDAVTNGVLKVNVTIGTWADNQILKYDSASGSITNEADAGGGGGELTPWTNHVNAAGYALTNCPWIQVTTNVEVGATVGADPGVWSWAGTNGRYRVTLVGGAYTTNFTPREPGQVP